MSRILDPRFKYVKAAETDVAATFRRIRREIQAKLNQQQHNAAEAAVKVKPLIKAKAA